MKCFIAGIGVTPDGGSGTQEDRVREQFPDIFPNTYPTLDDAKNAVGEKYQKICKDNRDEESPLIWEQEGTLHTCRDAEMMEDLYDGGFLAYVIELN